VNQTFGRQPDKETFWLLLWIWTKVTRSAGRNKGWEYKVFEWKLIFYSPKVMDSRLRGKDGFSVKKGKGLKKKPRRAGL
jgi:hypothetical protein